MAFFFGAAEGLAGPLLGGFDDGLVVASRFFGASVAAMRFLFFWAAGVVKKDDMVAVANPFSWVLSLSSAFFFWQPFLTDLRAALKISERVQKKS